MQSIRSIIWIGPGRGLDEHGIMDTASLDVVWVRDTDDALDLSLVHFDAAVLAQDEPARLRDALERLRARPGVPPLLVLAGPTQADEIRGWLGGDSGEVLSLDRDEPCDDRTRRRLGQTLVSNIERLVERRSARPVAPARARAATLESARHPRFPEVIGRSRPMRNALDLVERAAGGSTTILLNGETGTGKEVFARAVHKHSPRARGPFVAVNCAAFNESLLESELFGHVKGSFTGASANKPGLFNVARGGTLFLDEVGETSAALQAKLLRTLQEREVRPVGSNVAQRVDVRIVAATNRDLRIDIANGVFRKDLYYRLAVFPIVIPPLRQRSEDILPLAQHFLQLHHEGDRARRPLLTQSAADALLMYAWPGNVRELENEMQRALALIQPGEPITPRCLSDQVRNASSPIDAASPMGETLRQVVARVESLVIQRTLANNGGRRAVSARQLGITREGLYKKMKRLNIE